ncbi:MAG: hypothetical protein ABC537_02900 [Candidatus Methanosuratincola sp.]
MSWDEWYRKRFLPFFSSDFPARFRDIDEWVREMEAQMERMFREFEGRVPEKRRDQGDGSIRLWLFGHIWPGQKASNH